MFLRSSRILPAIFTLVAVPMAQAELLLYEGFDYTTGNDALVGQSGGSGWGASAWAEGGAVAGSLQNAGVVNSTSLVFSDFATTGNVGQVQNNHFGGGSDPYARHFATRELPTLNITPGSTVYSSFLFRQEQGASGSHESEVSVGVASGGRDKLRQVPVDFFGSNGPDSVQLGYGSAKSTSAGQPSINQDPLLFITRFENFNGAGSQTASMYVLTESDYDLIKSGGITQLELDTLGAAVTNTTTGVTLAGGDFLTLSALTGFGIQNNSFYDEYKLFTDLSDLQSTAIPEPASLALLGLGGLCLVSRRRRIS